MIRKTIIWVSGILAALIVVVGSLSIAGVCDLKTVRMDGAELSQEEITALGLTLSDNIFRQDCDLTAAIVSRRSGIGTVAVNLKLPNTIEITTNNFEPVFGVVDEKRQRLLGLDGGFRAFELQPQAIEKLGPTFTGVTGVELFQKPEDVRVDVVANSLLRIREKESRWFKMISAVDFSNAEAISVTFTTHEFLARISATESEVQLTQLFRMIENDYEQLKDAKAVDLRFDGVISIERRDTSNGRQG